MKLEYFDLLSPVPIHIENVGNVKPPTLRDIASISYYTYSLYLSIMVMTPESFFTDLLRQEEYYKNIPDSEKVNLNMFELLTANPDICQLIEKALDFFIEGTLLYDKDRSGFLVFDSDDEEEQVTGIITKQNWTEITGMIAQLNFLNIDSPSDLSKVKSQKARERLLKMEQLRPKKNKPNENLDLANIISAVAGKSENLNLITIWDLTVYQLWDTFKRLNNNHMLGMQSMSVSVWGDKDNRYEADAWYKNYHNKDN